MSNREKRKKFRKRCIQGHGTRPWLTMAFNNLITGTTHHLISSICNEACSFSDWGCIMRSADLKIVIKALGQAEAATGCGRVNMSVANEKDY